MKIPGRNLKYRHKRYIPTWNFCKFCKSLIHTTNLTFDKEFKTCTYPRTQTFRDICEDIHTRTRNVCEFCHMQHDTRGTGILLLLPQYPSYRYGFGPCPKECRACHIIDVMSRLLHTQNQQSLKLDGEHVTADVVSQGVQTVFIVKTVEDSINRGRTTAHKNVFMP